MKPCAGCAGPSAATVADALPRTAVGPGPMRCLMSLWTAPPTWRAERGPLLIQTLAIELARRAFGEVRLVTDERGARLAAALGWPCEVSTELEAFRPEGQMHIWALGKLAALSLQPGPCLYTRVNNEKKSRNIFKPAHHSTVTKKKNEIGNVM